MAAVSAKKSAARRESWVVAKEEGSDRVGVRGGGGIYCCWC